MDVTYTSQYRENKYFLMDMNTHVSTEKVYIFFNGHEHIEVSKDKVYTFWMDVNIHKSVQSKYFFNECEHTQTSREKYSFERAWTYTSQYRESIHFPRAILLLKCGINQILSFKFFISLIILVLCLIIK